MKKPKKDDIKCTIHAVYGFLSDKEDKAVVSVSWNDGPARIEVRRCWKDKKSGELKLGAGIALSDEEIRQFEKIVKKIPKPVDFSQIFEDTDGIVEKNRQGFKTKDGFIVLTKREKQ